MSELDRLLARLEELLVQMEELGPPVRDDVFELLDGIDTLHGVALRRLGNELGPEETARLRAADPFIAWLLDAYGVGRAAPAEAPTVTRVELGETRR